MTDRRSAATVSGGASTAVVFGVVLAVVVFGTVASAGALVGTATPGRATPDDRQTAPTQIDDCTTVTESGQYVLAGDVRNDTPTDPRTGLGACIEIRADDVVLDGAGHTVAAGPNGTPGVVGVLVGARASPSNVTVRDLTTTRWGAGVAIVGAENATLSNVSAVENLGDGFFVENAPNATIRGGEIRASNTGVFVRNAPGATVADLTASENIAGVTVRQSDDATVRGVEASENRQYGVGVFTSDSVAVADSVFGGNDLAGVALAQSDAHLRNLTLPSANASESESGWAVYAVQNSTAVGEQVRVGATTLSFEARDVALAPESDSPPLPITERQVVGSPIFALPTGEGASISLTIRYTDAALDRASTTEDTLSLWRFDAGEGWDRMDTAVDADRNAASATVENLDENGTVVALVGEGLAESGTETANQSSVSAAPFSAAPPSACASPASRYSC